MVAAQAAAPSALAWQYDARPGVSRYRDPSSGRFIGAAQVRQLRDDFLDAQVETVRNMARDLAADALTLGQWEQAMRDRVQTVVGVEYAFGRGGLNNMARADWDAVSQLVVDQYRYLSEFAGDIETGTLTEPEIGARAEMYVGAGTQAYERGAASAEDVELPAYPGEDCLGMGNCRCSWLLDSLPDGTVEAYWLAEADPCAVCAEHGSRWSPLVIPPEAA